MSNKTQQDFEENKQFSSSLNTCEISVFIEEMKSEFFLIQSYSREYIPHSSHYNKMTQGSTRIEEGEKDFRTHQSKADLRQWKEGETRFSVQDVLQCKPRCRCGKILVEKWVDS